MAYHRLAMHVLLLKDEKQNNKYFEYWQSTKTANRPVYEDHKQDRNIQKLLFERNWDRHFTVGMNPHGTPTTLGTDGVGW